ncbi:hypothetical protein HUU40_24730 [candidate division KSB1 bacterium]|nr:hypothetical protein [candidate division KSB1 bacterium]
MTTLCQENDSSGRTRAKSLILKKLHRKQAIAQRSLAHLKGQVAFPYSGAKPILPLRNLRTEKTGDSILRRLAQRQPGGGKMALFEMRQGCGVTRNAVLIDDR